MAAQIIAEFEALGAWCVLHGPEIWLGVTAICLIGIGVALGLWLAALLGANGEDDDER